jgi:hypothetical protein
MTNLKYFQCSPLIFFGMVKNINHFFVIGTLFLIGQLFYSCTKFENVFKVIGPIPQQIKHLSVVNLNGSATIKYKIPEDPNFFYVRAEYETSPGVVEIVKASSFNTEINVVGFGDTLEHRVKLYSVSGGEASSEPVEVTVKPHTPPYVLTQQSLSVSAAFGGIKIEGINESKASLAITPLVDTTGNGDWLVLDKINTVRSTINTTIRSVAGFKFDTIPYKIGVVVTDIWQHTSDTLTATVKPLYETLIDKNRMTYLKLPGDAEWFPGSSFDLWLTDDLHKGWIFGFTQATDLGAPAPVTFGIDNVKGNYTVSRIVIYPYREPEAPKGYYVKWAPKIFEIWGSNQETPDSSLSKWDKLGSFESTKPSGLPYGAETGEDGSFAYNGWEFDVSSSGNKAYKYLRLVSIQNWGGLNNMGFSSFRLYGVKQ